MRNGEYARITSNAALAQTLRAHLREVKNDLHLEVRTAMTQCRRPPDGVKRLLNNSKKFAISVNFGFAKIDRLEGNIGYLRMRFIPADAGAETAIAAMAFLAHTNALIFD